jgi:glycosyltransferase involved in cell wall biosynthesis
MPKKIKVLINGLTLDDANLAPLINKIIYWQSKKTKIIVYGSKDLILRLQNSIANLNSISLTSAKPLRGGLFFLTSALSRNIKALQNIKIIPRVSIVYSVSSVLDLILLPYLLKKINKAGKWLTVFDNTVPLFANGKIISGNLVVRILAWIFFKISLLLLRSADTIFVVKPELKDYLVSKGFAAHKIIITGNGIEKELILKAKISKKYSYDALFIGRINEAKGIYDLLKVASIVKKKLPKFKLALMGRGDDNTEENFKKKIKMLNLQKNIVLLGFKTGQVKYDIIKSCKVFLFLSQTESVPVAPMEAICSGKITLVYKLDAYNMYKNNELNIFNQGDYISVAKKVVEILNSGNIVNYAGLKLINKYSWNTIAKKEFKHFQ